MSNFPVLTADDEGIIYAVNAANGQLEWYRDKARDGVSGYNSWVDQDGEMKKEGWGEFTRIVSGGNGVIYAVDAGGNLLYFRHMARDSTDDWAYDGIGQQIGTGWGDFQHIVGGGCGILYAVDAGGNLLYYRDRARDGTADWAYGGVGQQIGTGWGRFSSILGGGCGILYATTPDPLSADPFGSTDYMYYYRDKAQDGTQNWANSGQGQQIGSGW